MNINEIFKEVFDVNAEKLDKNTKLTDIEAWDSMTHMILISKIEEVYEIELTGDEIAGMQDLETIKEILQNRKVHIA
ncbi:MAG: hypothetical protein COB85_04850 [Bacteroidetes bacterium]|nr:MAG: hypothetical protein COB85_04850 [Bacteroidota bacterium]